MRDRNLLKDAVTGAAILYALFLASHFRHPYLIEQAALEATCATARPPDECFFYSKLGLVYDNSAIPPSVGLRRLPRHRNSVRPSDIGM